MVDGVVEIKEMPLILPSTFFTDCFKKYITGSQAGRDRQMTEAIVIAEFIMTRKAFYPDSTIAATTKIAYKEFRDKFNDSNSLGLLSLSALEDAIIINRDPSVNALRSEQSILAIANDMYAENDLNPIIVVKPESKENWVTEYSDAFYLTHKEAKYRVPIHTMGEALIQLKSTYPEIYEKTIKNLLSEGDEISRLINVHINYI